MQEMVKPALVESTTFNAAIQSVQQMTETLRELLNLA